MTDAQTQTVLSPGPAERCGTFSSVSPSHHELQPTTFHGFPLVDSSETSFYTLLHSSQDTVHRESFQSPHVRGDPYAMLRHEPSESSRHPPSPDSPHKSTSMPHATNMDLHHGSNVYQHPPPDRHEIDEIEQQEDDIRDAREELLGARFRLKDLRRQLRDLRQEVGLKEGSVISQLRGMIQAETPEFAIELENDYALLLELRDRLSSLESTYEEEEERYEQLEWKYTLKEADFIARLTEGDGIPPAPDLIPSTDELYAQQHAESFGMPPEFRDLWPEINDFSVPSYQQSLFEIEGVSQEIEQRSQSLRTYELPSSTFENQLAALHAEAFVPLLRAHSEPALSQVHLAWNATRKRIDEWILDSISCSSYQKFLLRRVFSQDNLDDAAWWLLLKQTWNSNSPSTPPRGMDGLFSISSSEVIDDSIASVSVTTLGDKADTERPESEAVSQTDPAPAAVEEVPVQLTSASMNVALHALLDRKSDNTPPEAYGVKEHILSTASLPQTLSEAHAGYSNARITMPAEMGTTGDQNLTSPVRVGFQSTIRNHHAERNNTGTAFSRADLITESNKGGITFYHIRPFSEPSHSRDERMKPQPEDPSPTHRPRSPDFGQEEHVQQQDDLLSPYDYCEHTFTPPRTRSSSPGKRRASVQKRSY